MGWGQLLLKFVQEWRALRAFNALDDSYRNIVFYSEGPGDWPHIGPVIECLLREHDVKISFLSSDPRDPGLKISDPKYYSSLIGFGFVRTLLFKEIDCKHFVMTLPDIETFHLKRSVNNVHYVYMFHSINSSHLVYRKGAYDGYDTILCVGPHHMEEIRKTEAVYQLKSKELIAHGSVKLDTILAQFKALPAAHGNDGTREILIAPSWGESSLIEQAVGSELIAVLLQAGYRVTLRLHPMTLRHFPDLATQFRQQFNGQALFQVEENMNATESWMRSAVMISDWSGAAMEYSFSLLKPVIFINTKQKINNPEWQKINCRALEDFIRFEIGRVVEPADITSVPAQIEECCSNPESMREKILAARSRWVFNVGRSSQVAAAYLASLP